MWPDILLAFGKTLIERVFPDPAAQAAAQLELARLAQTGELAHLAADTDLAKGQLQINAAEATSANLFVSGWRPAIGWTCGAAFAYVSIVEPLARFVATMSGYSGAFPLIDTNITLQVLMGLLGLGAFRTIEKLKDKA
jgi:hypothetical protein